MVTGERVSADAIEPFEVRAIAGERLTFFADAVIAIAITLLALDLPVPPTGETNREVLHFVSGHREEYIAFLISFAVIGAYWRGHHRVFRYVIGSDSRLVRFTMIFLLTQIVTPFATRTLTVNGAFQARFIFYALVQVVAAAALLLILHDVRRHGLFRDDIPPALLPDATWRSAMLAAGFLVSIPLSFVNAAAAYACWLGFPLAGAAIRRARHHRAQREPGHSSASRP